MGFVNAFGLILKNDLSAVFGTAISHDSAERDQSPIKKHRLLRT